MHTSQMSNVNMATQPVPRYAFAKLHESAPFRAPVASESDDEKAEYRVFLDQFDVLHGVEVYLGRGGAACGAGTFHLAPGATLDVPAQKAPGPDGWYAWSLSGGVFDNADGFPRYALPYTRVTFEVPRAQLTSVADTEPQFYAMARRAPRSSLPPSPFTLVHRQTRRIGLAQEPEGKQAFRAKLSDRASLWPRARVRLTLAGGSSKGSLGELLELLEVWHNGVKVNVLRAADWEDDGRGEGIVLDADMFPSADLWRCDSVALRTTPGNIGELVAHIDVRCVLHIVTGGIRWLGR